MPVDLIEAVLILHDGDRSDVLIFLPPTEDIVHLLSEGAAFVAVMRDAAENLVARDAIACIGVPSARGPKLEEDIPAQRQAVTVKLRSGVSLDGELRWIAPPGQQRTSDYLNSSAPHLVLYADLTYVIAKPHVTMVIEK